MRQGGQSREVLAVSWPKMGRELERENKEPKAWGGLGRSMLRFWSVSKEKGRQEENGKLCLSNSGLR